MPPTQDQDAITRNINWLENVKSLYGKDELDKEEFVSWVAFHASLQPTPEYHIDIVALLPLFLENAHSVAMILHGMNVVNDVVQHLNPGQIPVIAMDQPLFAIAKQIQWNNSNAHGEDHYVDMFGGLHIEMAVMKCIGEWLNGSGWVTALVNAGITSVGTAESFLKVSYVARTRHAHEVTAAAMYVLQQTAFEEYKESVQESEKPLDFTAWCNKMKSNQPQFCFWSQVLKLEL